MAVLVVGCGETPSQETPVVGALSSSAALLVVGNTTLSAADSAFQRRLTTLGFSVTVVKDSAATAAQATGKQLVVISSTVVSTSVNTKFRTVAVPVLVWEPNLFGSMAMTSTSGTVSGTTSGQTQLAMVAPSSDPLAAGLSGTQTVTTTASTFTWGQPASSAVVVARIPGSTTHAAIYRYEKGASMADLTAPERRVGFFLGDTTASALASAGQILTDAAIRWAAHLASGLGAPCTASSGCASGFCVAGVCCNSACTGACVSCTNPSSVGTCVAAPTGTVCGAASCSGGNFSKPPICNGSGTCQGSAVVSCAPYTCTSAGCKTTCTADTDCASGDHCVNASCVSLAGLGAACTTSAQCASGICTGGVCCNSACTGACSSCTNPGSVGTCVAAPAGTVCGAASCSGSSYTKPPICDGAGVCQSPTVVSCAPFACTPAGCPSTCTSDSNCAAGDHCVNGTCGAASGLGAACTTSAQCASGICTGGVCCNSACTGVCLSCSMPGAVGTCSPVVTGTPCGPSTCSGSSYSAPGVCTGTGVCQSGALVSCAPYTCTSAGCKTACTADTDCATGDHCINGSCVVLAGLGAACSSSAQCASGFCAGGICCNTACTGTCVSCTLPGTVGTCVPTTGNVCGPATCVGSTFSPPSSCTGTGTCQASIGHDCAPFACTASGCKTACASDTDCATGAHCLNGICS